MFPYLKRQWKYLIAKLNASAAENADPKIQLQQAIEAAHLQDRRLREQAANVMATRYQTEKKVDTTSKRLSQLNANARQALLMADDAQRSGDTEKAAQYATAAETIAAELVTVETDLIALRATLVQAEQAAAQAKAAAQQNARRLEQKVAEQSALMSRLDQAKMQESMNTAMDQLSATVGGDVPSLGEISEKITARYAKASATAELQETTVESRVLEIEQASANVAAQSRLAALRGELGLDERSSGSEHTTITSQTAQS